MKATTCVLVLLPIISGVMSLNLALLPVDAVYAAPVDYQGMADMVEARELAHEKREKADGNGAPSSVPSPTATPSSGPHENSGAVQEPKPSSSSTTPSPNNGDKKGDPTKDDKDPKKSDTPSADDKPKTEAHLHDWAARVKAYLAANPNGSGEEYERLVAAMKAYDQFPDDHPGKATRSLISTAVSLAGPLIDEGKQLLGGLFSKRDVELAQREPKGLGGLLGPAISIGEGIWNSLTQKRDFWDGTSGTEELPNFESPEERECGSGNSKFACA